MKKPQSYGMSPTGDDVPSGVPKLPWLMGLYSDGTISCESFCDAYERVFNFEVAEAEAIRAPDDVWTLFCSVFHVVSWYSPPGLRAKEEYPGFKSDEDVHRAVQEALAKLRSDCLVVPAQDRPLKDVARASAVEAAAPGEEDGSRGDARLIAAVIQSCWAYSEGRTTLADLRRALHKVAVYLYSAGDDRIRRSCVDAFRRLEALTPEPPENLTQSAGLPIVEDLIETMQGSLDDLCPGNGQQLLAVGDGWVVCRECENAWRPRRCHRCLICPECGAIARSPGTLD